MSGQELQQSRWRGSVPAADSVSVDVPSFVDILGLWQQHAAQSRLSFHLRVLKDAGIVRDRKDGRWVYYELESDAFEEVETLVSAMKPRSLPIRHADACCA